MTYILPVIAVLFAIGSYGLMHRTIWAWHLGLVYLFLLAGKFCYAFWFYSLEGGSEATVWYSAAGAAGGLCLWLCGLLWWIKKKPEFRGWY